MEIASKIPDARIPFQYIAKLSAGVLQKREGAERGSIKTRRWGD